MTAASHSSRSSMKARRCCRIKQTKCIMENLHQKPTDSEKYLQLSRRAPQAARTQRCLVSESTQVQTCPTRTQGAQGPSSHTQHGNADTPLAMSCSRQRVRQGSTLPTHQHSHWAAITSHTNAISRALNWSSAALKPGTRTCSTTCRCPSPGSGRLDLSKSTRTMPKRVVKPSRHSHRCQ